MGLNIKQIARTVYPLSNLAPTIASKTISIPSYAKTSGKSTKRLIKTSKNSIEILKPQRSTK